MFRTARARARRRWKLSLRRRAQRTGGDPGEIGRAIGAGELVKFGQPVWYRFLF